MLLILMIGSGPLIGAEHDPFEMAIIDMAKPWPERFADADTLLANYTQLNACKGGQDVVRCHPSRRKQSGSVAEDSEGKWARVRRPISVRTIRSD